MCANRSDDELETIAKTTIDHLVWRDDMEKEFICTNYVSADRSQTKFNLAHKV